MRVGINLSALCPFALLLLQACGGGGGGDGLRGPTPDELTLSLSPANLELAAGHAASLELSLTNSHRDRMYTELEINSCPPAASCAVAESIWVEATVRVTVWVGTTTSTPVGDHRVGVGAQTFGVVPARESAQATIVVSPDASGLTFQQTHYQTLARLGSGLSLGHLDDDGQLDVAISAADSITLLHSTPDGILNEGERLTLLPDLGTLEIIDLSGDQEAFLIVAGGSPSSVISVPMINGLFGEPVITELPDEFFSDDIPRAFDSGDFDQDGIRDLVVTSPRNAGVRVLIGNADGTFELSGSFAIEDVGRSLVVGDLDSDGIEDVVVGVETDLRKEIRRLLGVGDGTFSSSLTVHSVGKSSSYLVSYELVLQNLNNDRIVDIVTGGEVFFGAGAADYYQPIDLNTRGYVTGGDFNGDGMTDLAFSGGGIDQRRIAIVLNEGMDRFSEPVRILVEEGGGRIATGDLNGDGKPDLVVVGANSLIVLLNEE